MKKIVIDSCIFMKLFLHEKDSEKAIDFLSTILTKRTAILAPELFFYEVFSAAMREELVSLKEVMLMLQKYKMSGLKLVEPDLATIKTAKEITRSGHKKSGFPSFYDSIYQALAITNDCDFVTTDKKHHKKTKKFGNIRLLSELVE